VKTSANVDQKAEKAQNSATQCERNDGSVETYLYVDSAWLQRPKSRWSTYVHATALEALTSARASALGPHCCEASLC
jgi:hypothetical protein